MQSRSFAFTAALTGALSLTAFGAVASPRAEERYAVPTVSEIDAIPSTAEEALPPPPAWDCERIIPEYRAWLEAGNAPSDWKHAGRTYRDVASDELYTWQDWLDWLSQSDCEVGALVEGEVAPLALPLTVPTIATAVSSVGAAGLAGSTIFGNDSPG